MDPRFNQQLEQLLVMINEVLTTSQRPGIPLLQLDLHLQDDLGLDSLELAELTVRIESATGVDVFKDGLVTTVGEIVEKIGTRN
jgi:acyl carrier protein